MDERYEEWCEKNEARLLEEFIQDLYDDPRGSKEFADFMSAKWDSRKQDEADRKADRDYDAMVDRKLEGNV